MNKHLLFLDRDGTLMMECGYPSDPNQVKLCPGVGSDLKELTRAGWQPVVVSNQSGIARGLLSVEDVEAVNGRLTKECARFGVNLKTIKYCPHHPTEGESSLTRNCDCRKPGTAMIDEVLKKEAADPGNAAMVGDKDSDQSCGQAAGLGQSFQIQKDAGLSSIKGALFEQMKKKQRKIRKRILVRCPNWVGDMAMAVPALRALYQQHPDDHITLFCQSYVYPIVEGLPYYDQVIFSQSWWHDMVTIRQQHFDQALLLTDSFSSALMMRLAGISDLTGYDRHHRSFLLSQAVEPSYYRDGKEDPPYRVDSYGDLLKIWDITLADKDLEADTLYEDERQADLLLKTVPPGKRVGLCPGAKYGSSKAWPPKHFATFAQNMMDQGYQVLLFVGPGEDSLKTEIISQVQGIHCFENMSLGTLKAMIKSLDLFLANDSGPSHIGVGLQVPTIRLYGPMDRRYSAHPDSPRLKSLGLNLDCQPCNQRICPLGHHRCMLDLDPGMVLQQAEAMLKS